HRLITESDVMPGVSEPVLQHEIVTSTGQAHGWLARFGVLLTDGNDVEILVDNETAWGRLTDEVRTAATSVNLSQLQFEVESNAPALIVGGDLFTEFSPDPPVTNVPTTGVRVQERLKNAGGRGLAVRVLVNDFLLLPFPADTYW